jgi:hypothetical protein
VCGAVNSVTDLQCKGIPPPNVARCKSAPLRATHHSHASMSTLVSTFVSTPACSTHSIVLLNNYLRPMSNSRFEKFWRKFNKSWDHILLKFHFGVIMCLTMCMCLSFVKFWPHMPSCILVRIYFRCRKQLVSRIL